MIFNLDHASLPWIPADPFSSLLLHEVAHKNQVHLFNQSQFKKWRRKRKIRARSPNPCWASGSIEASRIPARPDLQLDYPRTWQSPHSFPSSCSLRNWAFGKQTVELEAQVHNDAWETWLEVTQRSWDSHRNACTNTAEFVQLKKKLQQKLERRFVTLVFPPPPSRPHFPRSDPGLTTTWLFTPPNLMKLVFKSYLGSFQVWFAWKCSLPFLMTTLDLSQMHTTLIAD